MSSCARSFFTLLPPGFVRIRNFGFLANRNRGYVPAALLPPPRRIREALCSSCITRREDAHSLWTSPCLTEEPCTSSNDSPLRNSCSAPTKSERMCCMNRYRILAFHTCFARARRSLVSSVQKPSVSYLFSGRRRLRFGPRSPIRPLEPQIQPIEKSQHTHRTHSRPIQST